jgi:acyl carrier protein
MKGMTQAAIEEEAKEILAEILGVDGSELTPGALLGADLGMDSLDRIEISLAIEDRLLGGPEIATETLESWQTVKDVLDTVRLEHKDLAVQGSTL